MMGSNLPQKNQRRNSRFGMERFSTGLSVISYAERPAQGKDAGD